MGHNNNNAHALPFQGCVVGKVRKLGVKVLDAQRPCYYGYFHLWGESHPTPVSPQASSPLPTPSSRAPSRRPESSGLIPRLLSGVHQAGLGPGQWQECRASGLPNRQFTRLVLSLWLSALFRWHQQRRHTQQQQETHTLMGLLSSWGPGIGYG